MRFIKDQVVYIDPGRQGCLADGEGWQGVSDIDARCKGSRGWARAELVIAPPIEGRGHAWSGRSLCFSLLCSLYSVGRYKRAETLGERPDKEGLHEL